LFEQFFIVGTAAVGDAIQKRERERVATQRRRERLYYDACGRVFQALSSCFAYFFPIFLKTVREIVSNGSRERGDE